MKNLVYNFILRTEHQLGHIMNLVNFKSHNSFNYTIFIFKYLILELMKLLYCNQILLVMHYFSYETQILDHETSKQNVKIYSRR